MRGYPVALVLALSFLLPSLLHAQAVVTPDGTAAAEKAANTEAAIHDELRALRGVLTDSISDGNVGEAMKYVHENVVVTWQNNEVVRGRDQLNKFMAEANTGPDGIFQGYKQPPAADELTILYGDNIGLVFGSSVPQYKLLGMEFDLNNRWTAMVVKEGGQWQLAGYHVSANLLDNPVLDIAKKGVYWSAGIALIGGFLLGLIVHIFMVNRRKPSA